MAQIRRGREIRIGAKSVKPMQLVILAGGRATRLKEHAHQRPKALMEVGGKPFLHHLLAYAKKQGVEEVVLCIGHLGEHIREFAGDGSKWGLRIIYSDEGPDLLGTGGAIKKALPLLKDEFLVQYADAYLPTDYGAAKRSFDASGLEAQMCVFENHGKLDESNVELDAARALVIYYGKPKKGQTLSFVDCGLLAYKREVFENYPDDRFDLTALDAILASQGRLGARIVSERFWEIGRPESLSELRKNAGRLFGA